MVVVPTRVARETAQGRIDTSMIGRIWRRVMQIRGSAGVDLMARAQVRAHREPCGSLEKGRGGRTFHVVGTVLVMGPRFSPFLGFRAICPARCSALVNAQEEIFEEAYPPKYYFDRLSR